MRDTVVGRVKEAAIHFVARGLADGLEGGKDAVLGGPFVDGEKVLNVFEDKDLRGMDGEVFNNPSEDIGGGVFKTALKPGR